MHMYTYMPRRGGTYIISFWQDGQTTSIDAIVYSNMNRVYIYI